MAKRKREFKHILIDHIWSHRKKLETLTQSAARQDCTIRTLVGSIPMVYLLA